MCADRTLWFPNDTKQQPIQTIVASCDAAKCGQFTFVGPHSKTSCMQVSRTISQLTNGFQFITRRRMMGYERRASEQPTNQPTNEWDRLTQCDTQSGDPLIILRRQRLIRSSRQQHVNCRRRNDVTSHTTARKTSVAHTSDVSPLFIRQHPQLRCHRVRAGVSRLLCRAGGFQNHVKLSIMSLDGVAGCCRPAADVLHSAKCVAPPSDRKKAIVFDAGGIYNVTQFVCLT